MPSRISLILTGTGAVGLAVEAQHGAADLGDTRDLLLGHGDELRRLLGRAPGTHEVKHVSDGIEGIVNLVGDGGGEPAGLPQVSRSR